MTTTIADLHRRLALFQASPTAEAMARDDLDALIDRVLDERAFADLEEADKAAIRAGMLEVSDGANPGAVALGDRGDYAAIDAALDSGNLEELDQALATMGQGYGVPDTGVEDDDADDGQADDDVSIKGFDEDGWVGL